jgi:hypothetical protein
VLQILQEQPACVNVMVGGTTPLMAAVQGEHMHCAAVLLDHGATSSTEVPPAAVATGKDPATSLLVAAAGVLELLSNEHAVKDPGLLLSVGEAVRHLALQAQDAVEEASTGSPPAVQAEQCQQILTLLEPASNAVQPLVQASPKPTGVCVKIQGRRMRFFIGGLWANAAIVGRRRSTTWYPATGRGNECVAGFFHCWEEGG